MRSAYRVLRRTPYVRADLFRIAAHNEPRGRRELAHRVIRATIAELPSVWRQCPYYGDRYRGIRIYRIGGGYLFLFRARDDEQVIVIDLIAHMREDIDALLDARRDPGQ